MNITNVNLRLAISQQQKKNKNVLFDRIFCLIYQTFFEKKNLFKKFMTTPHPHPFSLPVKTFI